MIELKLNLKIVISNKTIKTYVQTFQSQLAVATLSTGLNVASATLNLLLVFLII